MLAQGRAGDSRPSQGDPGSVMDTHQGIVSRVESYALLVGHGFKGVASGEAGGARAGAAGG